MQAQRATVARLTLELTVAARRRARAPRVNSRVVEPLPVRAAQQGRVRRLVQAERSSE